MPRVIYPTLEQTASGLTTRISDAEGNISTVYKQQVV